MGGECGEGTDGSSSAVSMLLLEQGYFFLLFGEGKLFGAVRGGRCTRESVESFLIDGSLIALDVCTYSLRSK